MQSYAEQFRIESTVLQTRWEQIFSKLGTQAILMKALCVTVTKFRLHWAGDNKKNIAN